MKTTNEVIKAVQRGETVTELELQCALIALNAWRAGMLFDLARAITETENNKVLSAKTLRGLKRAWDALHTNFDRDLQTFIMGSSFEPGISIEERDKRRNDSTWEGIKALETFFKKKPTK